MTGVQTCALPIWSDSATPGRLRTGRASVIMPRPPTAAPAIMTAWPKGDQAVAVSTVVSPVTQTAEVVVNRASTRNSVDIWINGTRAWDMQVHREQLFQQIARQNSLGLGETYKACNQIGSRHLHKVSFGQYFYLLIYSIHNTSNSCFPCSRVAGKGKMERTFWRA